MKEATTAALLAMILIGSADTINKRARQLAVPIGSYLIIQSIFYTLVILFMALISGGITWQCADFVYALLGAIFGFTGFTLMLHSLTYGHAGINYAIFRSSFVFSATAAIIVLSESLYLFKFIGIILAFFSLLLFFYQPKQFSANRKSLITAILAMLVAAGFQLIIKLSTRVFSSPLSYILLMNIFFGIFVVAYNVVSGRFKFPKATFYLAPINGVLMAFATFFYVTALQKGDLSTVVPVIQLSFVITAMLAALFLKERVGYVRLTGIICAALAIIAMGIA